MRDAIKILAAVLVLAPCVAVFSEGEDVRVNLIGAVYALCLYMAVKHSAKIKKTVKTVFKSIVRLNPEINKI